MPFYKACPGCGGMVHIRKVRKHTLRSFRAIETIEKAADRRSIDKACKAKKRALETEEEGWNGSHLTDLV